MELMAAITGLEALKRPCRVHLTTDSRYVMQGIEEWVPRWQANGWRTAARKPVKNQDLWQRLVAAANRIGYAGRGCAGIPACRERARRRGRAHPGRDPANEEGGMRQIALDTETTGLEVQQGHRVIEIGAVELFERRVTRRTFHTYLNPDRAIDEGAREVTGIADEFLLDKPRFHEVVDDFLAFIEGAELIIHNAAFDVGSWTPNCSAWVTGTAASATMPRCSTPCRWRASVSPASATISMRCAGAWAWTMPTATCTAACSTPSCWPRSTWR